MPPQYHAVIMSQVRAERATGSTGVGAPSHVTSPPPPHMPVRRPPIVYPMVPKTEAKDEKDEKDLKVEIKREGDATMDTVPDVAAEVPPAAVYINTAGVAVAGSALGPRAALTQPQPAAADEVPDVLAMEALLRDAHAAHGATTRAAAARKRPAAAQVVPAAQAAPAMRLHRPRRLRRKAAAPVGIHGLKQSHIEFKASVSKSMNAFQSWAYDTMRGRLRRAGYSDDFAKVQARLWHKAVKPVWDRVRGHA